MAVRNVSLKDEAYSRLKLARRYPTESFSEVVLRATWPEDTVNAGAFLRLVKSRRARFTDEELERVEELKKSDAPPEDKWDGR